MSDTIEDSTVLRVLSSLLLAVEQLKAEQTRLVAVIESLREARPMTRQDKIEQAKKLLLGQCERGEKVNVKMIADQVGIGRTVLIRDREFSPLLQQARNGQAAVKEQGVRFLEERLNDWGYDDE